MSDQPGAPTQQDQIHKGLELLRALSRGGEYVMFWTPNGGASGDKKRSCYVPTDGDLTPPRAWLDKANCYFGPAPTAIRREEFQASRNEDVAAVNALIADFDGKDFVEEEEQEAHYADPDLSDLDAQLAGGELRQKQYEAKVRGRLLQAWNQAKTDAFLANHAECIERAEIHIEQIPARPSVIIPTGGGFQAFWLLTDPQHLYRDGKPDDQARERMASILKRWPNFVGSDPAASDPRRVFRFPGSYNHKRNKDGDPLYGPNLHLVHFVEFNLDRRYDLAELEAMLPAEEEQPRRKRTAPPSDKIPHGRFFTQSEDIPKIPRHEAIDAYNAEHDIRGILYDYGYTDGAGSRLNYPGGNSNGVEINGDNTATMFSSSDPLYTGGCRVSPALAVCMLEHDGDVDAFLATVPGYENFQATLAQLRLWVRQTSFADFVPVEHQSINGYRTDATDTKVADALLDIAAKRGKWHFEASAREIMRACNLGSTGTVRKAISQRLSGWFVEEEAQEDGPYIYTINTDVARRSNRVVASTAPLFDLRATQDYSRQKARDAWQSGTARHWRKAAKQGVANGEAPPLPPDCNLKHPPSEVQRWLDERAPRGLGESLLRMIDALRLGGDMTRQELAKATGKTVSAVARATLRGEELGLLEAERESAYAPKVYALAPGIWEMVDEMEPTMRTYRMQDERQERSDEAIVRNMRWRLRYEKMGDEERGKLQKAETFIANRWAKTIQRLHPDWTPEAVGKWVQAPNSNTPTPAQEGRKRKAEMDRRTEERNFIMPLDYRDAPATAEEMASALKTWLEMKQEGIPAPDIYRQMGWAGFDRELIDAAHRQYAVA